MCRKNELLGTAILAVGAGLLLSLLFSSEFAKAIVGVGLMLCGLLCARHAGA